MCTCHVRPSDRHSATNTLTGDRLFCVPICGLLRVVFLVWGVYDAGSSAVQVPLRAKGDQATAEFARYTRASGAAFRPLHDSKVRRDATHTPVRRGPLGPKSRGL
jgi:hypothetical protein